jgi:hypothetical protein
MPAVDPIGPYERWMYGPGRYYDLPGLMLDHEPALSAVVEFKKPVRSDALKALTKRLTCGHVTMQPRLPTLYRPGHFHPRFLPVLLTPDSGPAALSSHDPASLAALLDQLADAGGAKGQIRLNFPLRSETLNTADPSTLPSLAADDGVDLNQPIVISAVIDHGIPFAHRAFRDRIEACWSQSALADNAGTVPFGREFTRTDIATLAAAHDYDEDAIYQAAGLLGRPGLPPMPLNRLNAHGAHVLGTLAGPPDPQHRIITVDLPATSVWDTSGFGLDMFLLAAMHYIFDRAERIAAAYNRPEMPLVINLSYGISGGPHDGNGLIGAAFDELIAYRRGRAPTALVMPSGNMFQDALFARLSDNHFTPRGNKRVASLQWLAPPADRTSSFIELWYPAGTKPGDVKVTLTPPRGIATDPSLTVGPGADGHAIMLAGRTVGQLTIDKYRGKRWRATIILAPSEPKALPPGAHAGVPAGLWTITMIRPDKPLAGSIDARIQVDSSYGQGNTGAQQSGFVDPAHDRYGWDGALSQADSSDPALMVRRFDGLNGMADGDMAMVAAGYVASSLRAARYSSAGPTPPQGKAVDVSAMTDRSPFHTGLQSTGTRTGVRLAQQGTSSAAPQIARLLARCFLATPPGPTTDNYLSLLEASPDCIPISDPGPEPTARDRLGSLRLVPPQT